MLSTTQKRKLLQRISTVENDIEELRRCRVEIAKCGYASASLSSTGGSKTYTRIDLSKITETINDLLDQLKQLNNLLVTGRSRSIETIRTIYW